MHGGKVERHDPLRVCSCGTEPIVIWHYIKGVDNRIHYFVKCENCKKRTQDRKRIFGAIKEWNNIVATKDTVIQFKNGSIIKTIPLCENMRGMRRTLPLFYDNFKLTKWQVFTLYVFDIKLKIYKRVFPYTYYTKYFRR